MPQITDKSAYILHVRNYGDNSKIADVLTPDFGKLSLLIKGVKKNHKKVGFVQPFLPLIISWGGRGELKTNSSIDPAGPPLMLKGDRLYCGLYINELTLRLVRPNDYNPELFELYHNTLQQLPFGSLEPLLRCYEKHILDLLGHGLILNKDVFGVEIDSAKIYEYSIESGARPVERCGDAMVVSGGDLLLLKSEEFESANDLRGVKNFMRSVLNCYLGNKPLKSRELFT
ncbi:MAG: DNA repair protein RecO [Gammaproteobacteria bacterium]|nr:MAG: DNA repair protein RecO [Gammaproteobacteria bacterium]